MKRVKYCLIAIVCLSSMIGCDSFNQKQLIGNYYLIESSYKEDSKSLSYSLGSGNFNDVVSQTVFSVGFNEDYIIAKQHPKKYKVPANKSITNYFIIAMKDSSSYYGKVNGPFTESEFLVAKKSLGISGKLKFTIVFEDLK